MPCAKCEKKLAASGRNSLATTDVWRSAGAGGDRNDRKVGENKLLSGKSRYSPYAPAASGSKAALKSASGGKAAQALTFGKCETVSIKMKAVSLTLMTPADLSRHASVSRTMMAMLPIVLQCKSTVSRAGSKYCQSEHTACTTAHTLIARADICFGPSGCAYKIGACSICGKKILDTTAYKMSSK